MNRLFIIVLFLLAFGCKKEKYIDTPINVNLDSFNAGKMTIIGQQLKNPYSVENMRKALNNLPLNTRNGFTDRDIQPTHYYVRFHPKSYKDLDMLQLDSTIIWYDFPLDYEIIEYGNYYHDPSIPDSLPTFQYASIEISKWADISSLGIKYEILSELFIPDEEWEDVEEVNGSVKTNTRSNFDNISVESIVNESLRITGNIDESNEFIETKGSNKWRPAGRISYYDDVNDKVIGLEGIKVKARRWFTTHTGITDENGYYSCNGRFKRPAHYSFNFGRYEFVVQGNKFPLMINTSKRKGDWDYHFARSESQYEFFVATVFRAAYHYYYKDIGGLRRPPMNSFWRTKMRIKAIDEQNNDINGNFKSARRFLGLGSAIKLYNPQNKTDDIYATTIHELAHAAHWRMIVKEPNTNRYRDYHYADDKMVESWATGVQWYLTKMVYLKYKGRPQGTPNYTNVVIDLVDSRSDDGTNNGKS